MIWPCREGGWRDFVFAAREAVSPRAPSVKDGPPPTFTLVDTPPASDNPCAEVLEARLGRRLCATFVLSVSITPGPMDLRGALTAFAAALPDIGGYWL